MKKFYLPFVLNVSAIDKQIEVVTYGHCNTATGARRYAEDESGGCKDFGYYKVEYLGAQRENTYTVVRCLSGLQIHAGTALLSK